MIKAAAFQKQEPWPLKQAAKEEDESEMSTNTCSQSHSWRNKSNSKKEREVV